MKDKEAAKEYISSFIQEKGGIPKVMNATGLGKQTVWQLSEKRNAASDKTIECFVKAYNDFDALRARGVNLTLGSTPAPGPDAESLYWKKIAEDALSQLTELRREVSDLKDELKSWQNAYKQIVNKSMGIDQEGVKIGSDSRNTADDVFNPERREQEVYGLIRYYNNMNAEAVAAEQDKCIVVKLMPETPVFPLVVKAA